MSTKILIESTSSSCYKKNKIVKGSCFEIGITEEHYGIQRLKKVVKNSIRLIKRLYLLV